MKEVIYKDQDGRLHRSLLRDTDSDNLAREGIPSDPPNIEDILEEAKIELHNELVKRGLYDTIAVERNAGALSSAVKKCITNKIVRKYYNGTKN